MFGSDIWAVVRANKEDGSHTIVIGAEQEILEIGPAVERQQVVGV